MKYIKSINELYDDPSHSLPKEEIRNIMNRKVWDKIHKGEYKKIADIPYDMKDELTKTHLDKVSKLYKYENNLKTTVPYLRKFKLVEKEEKGDYFKLKYLLEKNIEDVAVFSLELEIFGTWNGRKSFIFSPFIERTEKVKLDDPSYRTLNSEIVDEVESYIEAIKKLYNLSDTKEIMSKMENYFSDLKNGNIVSYEDSDFIKPLGFFHNATNEVSEKNILSDINTNIKMFDDYTKTMFNVSVFEK